MTNVPAFKFRWIGSAVGVNDRYQYKSAKKLSPQYADFMMDLAMQCRNANNELLKRPIADKIGLFFTQYISARRDADSLIKPLFDGIEKSGIITNDNKIRNYSCITVEKQRGYDDRIDVVAYLLEDDDV